MKKYFYREFLRMLLIIIAGLGSAYAQIPRTLSYQGVLTDQSDKAWKDGNYKFTFALYDSSAGGNKLWDETKTLELKQGLFSTVLGDVTPFDASVKFDKAYWLETKVGSEPELSPRTPLTSVGYSMNALRADTAKVSVTSLADSIWGHNGENIYRLNGNVGIGTSNPVENLHVRGANETEIVIGDFDPGNTYLRLGTTAYSSGSAELQSVAVSGSNYGILSLNPNGGSVGIGTSNPAENLHVRGAGATGIVIGDLGPGNTYLRLGTTAHSSGSAELQGVSASGSSYGILSLNPNGGNVGIGISNPVENLHVRGAGATGIVIGDLSPGNTYLRLGTTAHSSGYTELQGVSASGSSYGILSLNPNGGNVGIGTTNPTSALEVVGRTKTSVLEITGGGFDLAEQFETSNPEPLPKGALLVIDEANPGQLKLSSKPYDRCVAGIISGAGGIKPGLTLGQEEALQNGQEVALTGRVYGLATASNGAIKPGDLLTTSGIPGHAMKATDVARSFGTIVGKAMSSLSEGEGLVLVLINLQ